MHRKSIAMLAAALAAFVLATPLAHAQDAPPDPATAAPTTDGVVVADSVVRSGTGLNKWTAVDGVVENRSDAPLAVRTIAVSLLDQDGNTVGAAPALYKPRMLEPGQSSGWTAIMPGLGADDVRGTTPRIQVESGPAQQPYVPTASHELRADGVTIRPAPLGGLPSIQGQLVNTGAVALDSPRLILSVYDRDGRLVGVEGAPSTLSTVGPGQSSPFTHSLTGIRADKGSTVKVYAEGTPRPAA